MRDDIVSARAVVAVFVGLGLIVALVACVVFVSVGPSSSPNSPAIHAVKAISRKAPVPRAAIPPNPVSVSPTIAKVNWSPAVKAVGAIMSEGTNLVAVLAKPTPSAAGFKSACSSLAHQETPIPPAGSGGSQLSSLQAVESDDASLVADCRALVADSKPGSSSAAAIADGESVGRDLVSLRWDAANFYLAIGYSGGNQSKDASGLSEWTVAREIGFQESDFAAGTVGVPDYPGGPDEATPVPASTPCSPVHSQPFVADYDSQTYDPSGVGNDAVNSETLIMPPADAEAALQAIGAPGYDTACFQAALDSDTQSLTPTSSCGSFKFISSSIRQDSPVGFPQGSVVYRYVANVFCTGDNQSGSVDIDVISSQVGSAFIQGWFITFQTPVSTQIEQAAMRDMSRRANSLQSASA